MKACNHCVTDSTHICTLSFTLSCGFFFFLKCNKIKLIYLVKCDSNKIRTIEQKNITMSYYTVHPQAPGKEH